MWTPERIQELMAMYANGHTSYEMARHFHVTRNSICGKIHRERVRKGIVTPAPRKRRKASPTDKQRKRDQQMLTLPSRALSVSAYISPASDAPDLGQLASIVDVTGCKWPVKDDPEFVGGVAFCNHDAADGSPYCPYHRSRAVYKAKPKPVTSLGPIGLRFEKRRAA